MQVTNSDTKVFIRLQLYSKTGSTSHDPPRHPARPRSDSARRGALRDPAFAGQADRTQAATAGRAGRNRTSLDILPER